MKRKTSLYIKDMLDANEKISEFIFNMKFEEFVLDDKTASAVIRKIEIIGEVVKQLPKEVINRFPEIPWSSLAKMRDKIIHFYHGLDYEIIWKVINEDLPNLKPKLEKIYSVLKKEEE